MDKLYVLPKRFYDDHRLRDCGRTGVVLESFTNTIVVQLDNAAFEDLRTDADYYWSCRDQFDSDYKSLCRSAKRTLDYLANVGAPNVN